jgi:multiple sugar transport system permease protein
VENVSKTTDGSHFGAKYPKKPKTKKSLLEMITSRNGQRNMWGYAFVTPALLIFILFTVVPIILAFSLSLTNIRSADSLNYKFVGFRNFLYIFGIDPFTRPDARFWDSLKNILLYTVITVPLTLTFSMILALIIKKPIRGTKFFRGLFYLPGITSGVATAMVWSYLFNGSNGIINLIIRGINSLFGSDISIILMNDSRTALIGIILMTLWGALGGNMVLFLARMNAIPTGIYEAATIDGANRRQTFFRITLPLMKPAFFFALTLSLIGSPQMFEPVLLMNANTTTPVYEIYNNALAGGSGMGLATAQSILLFFFIMVVTIAMQKVNNENYM